MQSHRGHLGKLLFKRMAELGGVQAADQLDPGALHHKTYGQGEQSPHIQQRGIPHREPEAGEAVSQLGDVLRPTQRGDEPAHLLRVAYGDWSVEEAASRPGVGRSFALMRMLNTAK